MSMRARKSGAATFKCVSGWVYLNDFEISGDSTAFKELPILGKLMHMPNASDS